MKNSIHSLLMIILFGSFVSFVSMDRNTNPVLEIITFADFERMTNQSSDKIRVFNFWATWCAPCVKEIPYFENVALENKDLELVFISMDDARKPERVSSFMEKKSMISPVYILDDVDYNKWIDKVSSSWSGAIPATLFIKPNGEKIFHEGEVTEEELNELISNLK